MAFLLRGGDVFAERDRQRAAKVNAHAAMIDEQVKLADLRDKMNKLTTFENESDKRAMTLKIEEKKLSRQIKNSTQMDTVSSINSAKAVIAAYDGLQDDQRDLVAQGLPFARMSPDNKQKYVAELEKAGVDIDRLVPEVRGDFNKITAPMWNSIQERLDLAASASTASREKKVVEEHSSALRNEEEVQKQVGRMELERLRMQNRKDQDRAKELYKTRSSIPKDSISVDSGRTVALQFAKLMLPRLIQPVDSDIGFGIGAGEGASIDELTEGRGKTLESLLQRKAMQLHQTRVANYNRNRLNETPPAPPGSYYDALEAVLPDIVALTDENGTTHPEENDILARSRAAWKVQTNQFMSENYPSWSKMTEKERQFELHKYWRDPERRGMGSSGGEE